MSEATSSTSPTTAPAVSRGIQTERHLELPALGTVGNRFIDGVITAFEWQKSGSGRKTVRAENGQPLATIDVKTYKRGSGKSDRTLVGILPNSTIVVITSPDNDFALVEFSGEVDGRQVEYKNSKEAVEAIAMSSGLLPFIPKEHRSFLELPELAYQAILSEELAAVR